LLTFARRKQGEVDGDIDIIIPAELEMAKQLAGLLPDVYEPSGELG
jgi:hypothetical protein